MQNKKSIVSLIKDDRMLVKSLITGKTSVIELSGPVSEYTVATLPDNIVENDLVAEKYEYV